MNKIINKFLLIGHKFMPQLHLKQVGFTYSICGSFTKHRERIQKFKETGNLKHFYRIELDKACFAHDASYSDCKDLTKRTMPEKVLKKKLLRYKGYQRALARMVYKFFYQKIRSGASVNEKQAEELHKPAVKKFKKRRVYERFKDNI